MGVNWAAPMEQRFEFYTVDPNTWCDDERLDCIIDCKIKYDFEKDTMGNCTFTSGEMINEKYIRIYLIAIQDDVVSREVLGTFLVQTPSYTYKDGHVEIRLDAYTPLLEATECKMPLGYTLPKGTDILTNAYHIVKDNTRCPVIKPREAKTLYNDYVANLDDTPLKYVQSMIDLMDYKMLLTKDGSVTFMPHPKVGKTAPKWIYTDDNTSILTDNIKDDYDLYKIPNVIEVVYQVDESTSKIITVENNDPKSPVSIQNRGRRIVHRETKPTFSGTPTEEYVKSWAENKLEDLSTVTHKVSYTHGYCPVHIGDTVYLNHTRAGFNNISAIVISQDINCTTGCTVNETALYLTSLYKKGGL